MYEPDDDDLAAEEQARSLRAWEKHYQDENTWEDLEEDESGRLRMTTGDKGYREKRRREIAQVAANSHVCKGMIRFLYVVLDLSYAVNEEDMRPSRLAVISALMYKFFREYFSQNPLSQLGLVVTRNGIAERLTELSGNPETHIAALKEHLDAAGDMSIQNSLELVNISLAQLPLYGSREVLFVVSGLSTCDPGNVHTAIAAAKSAKIRVSVVSVAAEMYLCRRMSEETGGMFGVSTSQHHLEELLMAHAPPPPLNEEATKASLVHMGFPQKRALDQGAFFSGRGGEYVCPRCSSRVEELPSQCNVCSLTLVSSPHLARSYHHLFPVAPFEDLGEGGSAAERCFACRRKLDIRANQGNDNDDQAPSVCGKCTQVFCFPCDAYIHERLHNCPGCENGFKRGD
jgi:transcription initiation factor TFIIH subunit 2